MKQAVFKAVLFYPALICLLLSGCSQEAEEIPSQGESASEIIVRAAPNAEAVAVRSITEPVVFTGDDILWFNEATKELRFKNNFAESPSNNPFIRHNQTIKFYMGDEYLFSSLICENSLSSQIYNSLVFFYDIIENKFYLTVGYPIDVSMLSNPQKAQEIRDENRRKIKPDWDKFIEQLKTDGKYRN
jgi:hypothetical protein